MERVTLMNREIIALRAALEEAFDRQDMEEALRLSALMDRLTVEAGSRA